MGLFGRKNHDAAPDQAFPFLTVDEAQEVRRLAAQAFAAAGHEAVIHADHLTAADGTVYGLWNVAAACKGAGKRRAWPAVVEAHVASLVNAPAGAAEMTVEDVLAHAVLRVYGSDTVPPEARDKLTYVREIADGLLEAVVLDTPTTVMMLLDDDVERCGRTELWAAGLEHLMAEPLGDVERLDIPAALLSTWSRASRSTPPASSLSCRTSCARCTASARSPTASWWRCRTGTTSCCTPSTTRPCCLRCKGPRPWSRSSTAPQGGGVSPSVYSWRDGALERLSSFDDEGRLRVDVREAFGVVLNRLTATIEHVAARQSPFTFTIWRSCGGPSTRSAASAITTSMSLYASGISSMNASGAPVLDARHRPRRGRSR